MSSNFVTFLKFLAFAVVLLTCAIGFGLLLQWLLLQVIESPTIARVVSCVVACVV